MGGFVSCCRKRSTNAQPLRQLLHSDSGSIHNTDGVGDEARSTSRGTNVGVDVGEALGLVPGDLRRFSLGEMEVATQKFSKRNIVGEGGFGVVFRGVVVMGNGGRSRYDVEVAVKRMKEPTEQNTEEFMRELLVLGKLWHPNVVRLLGYCMDKSEALLVYEFMQGGCLNRALNDSARGDLEFTWDNRMHVLVQVAEALEYMHARNFIHRDLKAANVLLTPEYGAKLTDFGMVRVGPDGQLMSIVSTQIMGTMGYIDPSYMETGQLGPKSDVYSFGVLMLEMLTGRRVLDEGSDMVDECRRTMADLQLQSAAYADPQLEGNYPELAARQLATLARHCVAVKRQNRPETPYVLSTLRDIQCICP
uniref:Receptor-like kinase n=1 Tax=Closterium ehrenbergii TaxID=102165 RepID=A7VM47_CLOEH|nr:receptor-like kinase [Closterium ehrenbergii]